MQKRKRAYGKSEFHVHNLYKSRDNKGIIYELISCMFPAPAVQYSMYVACTFYYQDNNSIFDIVPEKRLLASECVVGCCVVLCKFYCFCCTAVFLQRQILSEASILSSSTLLTVTISLQSFLCAMHMINAHEKAFLFSFSIIVILCQYNTGKLKYGMKGKENAFIFTHIQYDECIVLKDLYNIALCACKSSYFLLEYESLSSCGENDRKSNRAFRRRRFPLPSVYVPYAINIPLPTHHHTTSHAVS